MNYAAVDPDATNSKCSYWHFRLDADTSMKMEALTTYAEGPTGHQEGLHHWPELFTWQPGIQVRHYQ